MGPLHLHGPTAALYMEARQRFCSERQLKAAGETVGSFGLVAKQGSRGGEHIGRILTGRSRFIFRGNAIIIYPDMYLLDARVQKNPRHSIHPTN